MDFSILKVAAEGQFMPAMRLALLPLILSLSSCSVFVRKSSAPATHTGKFRIDEAVLAALKPEQAKIVIDLSKQEMSLRDAAGTPAVWTQVSSGRSSSPTPTGEFKVLEMLPTKFSNRYGKWVKEDTREVIVWRIWEHQGPQPPGTVYQGYEMPHWLRITWPGVGIHQGSFRPGELSSKGCIRVPAEPQKAIWEHVQLGTQVTISGHHAGFPDAP